jgi:hypothetical protein
MDPSNRLPHIVIGTGSHRASVQHDKLSRGRLGDGLEALLDQHGFECGSVGLGSAAAEIAYDELLHNDNILSAGS